MIITYKRKLLLNKKQEKRISSWIGACRVVYNLGMEIKNTTYKANGNSVSKFDLMKQITDLRKEVDWIEDTPVQCLQSSIEVLDRTYKNFFSNYKKGGGYPKFAKKNKFKSIHFKYILGLQSNSVKVMKIGWLKFFKDSEIKGTSKTATIIKEPTGFYICIQCEVSQKSFVSENQTIGLDMGISHFCVDSNGNFIANPKHFKKYEAKLRIEGRSLTRKKQGSNSWIRQAKKLSKLHYTIGNVRRDFLHKESTKIAKKNSIVYMEDLNIIGMSKNKHLSKYILDCGWGMFKTMLEYKTNVINIDPKFTSQTCNECGNKDSKSRISQSEFVCTFCGHVSNADVNAAKNILGKGITYARKRKIVV